MTILKAALVFYGEIERSPSPFAIGSAQDYTKMPLLKAYITAHKTDIICLQKLILALAHNWMTII